MSTVTNEQEIRFNDWMRLLSKDRGMSGRTKAALLKHLRAARTVWIVDARQFYADYLADEENTPDGDIYESFPYVIVAKGAPFAMIDSYPTVQHALDFCAMLGLQAQLYLYAHVSQATH